MWSKTGKTVCLYIKDQIWLDVSSTWIENGEYEASFVCKDHRNIEYEPPIGGSVMLGFKGEVT